MRIDSTSFGCIIVNKKKFFHDIMISPSGEIKEVLLETRHLISTKEFLKLSEEKPEVIVIGNGQYGTCEISEDFIHLAKEKEIELVIEDTPHALKRFNELASKGKRIAAYFHVTC